MAKGFNLAQPASAMPADLVDGLCRCTCIPVLLFFFKELGSKFFSSDLSKPIIYTTQNLLRITFSFNDLMLKTNRLKKDFFHIDRLIFGLDDPVANMSIRNVYYA